MEASNGMSLSARPLETRILFIRGHKVMLASVLSSPVAIQASIQVVRAFVRLREILSTHKDLAEKLAALERKYDAQFKVVFDAIRELMTPPVLPRRRIGFQPKAAVAEVG